MNLCKSVKSVSQPVDGWDSRPYLAPENFRVSAASREKNAAVKTKRTRRLALPVLRLVSVRLF